MHRNLFRAAWRSVADLSNGQKVQKMAWKNGVDRTQSSKAFSGSHDFDNCNIWANIGTRHAQLQIVNALQAGHRQQASDILLNLAEEYSYLTAKDFACILEYCAKTPDPLFAMETWKLMEAKDVDINNRCSSFIIQAFSKGGYIKEAFEWLNFLSKNGRVTLPMFNIVLSGCWRSKSLNYVNRCLNLMENQLVGKSEVTYWELLKFAVLQRNLSAVQEIWVEYVSYYSPSVIMLRKFIWSFSKLGDVESANAALRHLVVLARQGSSSLSISAMGQYQSAALDIPIPAKEKLYEKWFWSDNSTSLKYERNSHNSISPMEISMDGHNMKHFNVNINLELEKTSDSLLQCNIIDAHSSENIERTLLGKLKKGVSIPKSHNIFHDVEQDYNLKLKVEQEVRDLCNEKMKQGSEMIPRPLMNLLRWSFNDTIHACAQANNYQLAEQLFLQMLDIGLNPSKHTYDGFVKAAVMGKGIAHGIKVVEMMQEKGIKPYDDTFAVLSIGHSRNLELDLAESFADEISDNKHKYIHTYNDLLAACSIMDEPERAVRILAKIKRLNINLNIRTYELMIVLFGNVNVPYEKGNILSHVDVSKRIRAIEMDMANSGIAHSYESLKNLIRALGAEGMMQDMLQYLNVAENLLWQRDAYQRTDMYNIALHMLVKAKKGHKAIEVFKIMRSGCFPADVATYNIMIECCSMLTSFKSASAIVSLMLRDGFCPQTRTFTVLIKVLLANEDFEGALNILSQSKSEGVQLDIQLFNTILREACMKGRIDVVEFLLEDMRKEKIKPDPSTLWYTFNAYAENGFYNTAMEALQVLSMRMISEEVEKLQEKRPVFEELIFGENPEAESEIIDIFEDSQEFLATALLNLRWCAMMGCSISWSPEESQWAKRLAATVPT